jgi:cytochrome b involved in lipid metabolism
MPRPASPLFSQNNVYDVTDFVDAHPGGRDFILMAAGGAVDEFWDYWAYHYVCAVRRRGGVVEDRPCH